MLPNLLEYLTGEWRGVLTSADIILKEPLAVLKVAGDRGQDRKINFLVFNHRVSSPALLMKMTRSLRNHEKLVKEFKTLQTVSSIPGMKGKMPEPIGLFPCGDTFILIETCVPGVSLKSLFASYRHLRRSQVRSDLALARDWLLGFQTSTRVSESYFGGQVEVQERCERGNFKLPSEFIDELMGLAQEVEGMQIPLCARHGDFWPGNLMLSQNECSVIDWEGYSSSDLPFVDVFSFVITFSWSYSRQGLADMNRKEAFTRAFLKRNWLSDALRSFMEDTLCTPYGMDRKFLRLFFSLFLMDMAAPSPEEKAMHVAHAEVWRDHLNLFAKHAIQSSQI